MVLCSRKEVGMLVVLGVENSKPIMLFCVAVGGDGVQRLMKTGDGVLGDVGECRNDVVSPFWGEDMYVLWCSRRFDFLVCTCTVEL